MTQKLSQNQKLELKELKKNKSCSTTWIDPKTVFEPYPNPKNSPVGPQKVINDPKIKPNWKEEIIESERYSTTWVAPKSVFESEPGPKNSILALQ